MRESNVRQNRILSNAFILYFFHFADLIEIEDTSQFCSAENRSRSWLSKLAGIFSSYFWHVQIHNVPWYWYCSVVLGHYAWFFMQWKCKTVINCNRVFSLVYSIHDKNKYKFSIFQTDSKLQNDPCRGTTGFSHRCCFRWALSPARYLRSAWLNKKILPYQISKTCMVNNFLSAAIWGRSSSLFRTIEQKISFIWESFAHESFRWKHQSLASSWRFNFSWIRDTCLLCHSLTLQTWWCILRAPERCEDF